jgi:large subunit ribosomal protein L9
MAQMQVILLERIEHLGQMGDVVKVKQGFARNYLLPKKKAMRATEQNRAYFESRRAQLEADNLKRRSEAEGVADRMRDARIIVVRQAGESGQLYGSVSARDIADGLREAGYIVQRHQVFIDRPIKAIGIHPVRIALHAEVPVNVLVNVGQSQEEARLQQERFDRGEAPVVIGAEEAPAAPPPAAQPPQPVEQPPKEAAQPKPGKAERKPERKAKAAAQPEQAPARGKGKPDKREAGEKKGKR